MKLNLTKIVATLACALGFYISGSAQIDVMRTYVFTQDSVAGFDEKSASAAALANGCYGSEYNVFMYREKRTYVKQKYNLPTAPVIPLTLFNNQAAKSVVLPGGSCDNEDFEVAQGGSPIIAPSAVQGWTLGSGSNQNGCAIQTPNAVNYYTVFTGPVSDSKVSGQISSFFDSGSGTTPSGSCFIRLNNSNAGAKFVTMYKSFIPTSNSALFQYAYMVIVDATSPHSCCDQPGFDIKVSVTNTTTNTSSVLTCPNISVSIPGSACNYTIPPGGPSFSLSPDGSGWKYCDWTQSAIDLTQYIGSQVTISVTARDCTAGGHAGYLYFDAKCSPMAITGTADGNTSTFPASSQNVTLPTCGVNGVTICATPGLGPYSWAGPGVGSQTISSVSNACFVTTISATYTLYMNPPGACAPLTRVINTTVTPAPQLAISAVQAVCGNTLATISVTPGGSASSPSTLSWSPQPLTLNTTTTVATYSIPPGPAPTTVYVTASDPLGCLVTKTANVNPAAPAPTIAVQNITGSYIITCATPSIDLNATSTYTYGTLNYVWQSANFSYNTPNVSINTTYTAPYTVTVTATDPVTLCFDKKVVTITTNTTPPLSSISPSFQNITCGTTPSIVTLTSLNPTVNVSHLILDPFGGSYSTTAISAQYPPAPSAQSYTHVLTNLINGCSTMKTFTVAPNVGFPTFSLSSTPGGYTLGCSSKSVITISINGPDTDPPGGAVSYTLLFPGASVPTGTLGNVSSYTNVNIPGTYTVITMDNVTLCRTQLPITVVSNTFGPTIDSVIVPQTVLDCYVPKTTLKGISYTPDVSYKWSFPGTPGTQNGDSIVVNADFTARTTTVVDIFTLTVTNTDSKCLSVKTVTVYQNLFTPKAAITGTIALTCTTPTVLLSNASTSNIPPIFAQGKKVVGMLWEGPTPQLPQSNSTSYLAEQPGTYTMTAQDLGNGCTSSTTTNVPENRIYPVFSPVVSPTLACGGSATLNLVVTSATTGLLYVWTPPPGIPRGTNTLSSFVAADEGEYSAVVTNTLNGCVSTTNISVYNGSLTADFTPSTDFGYAPLTVNFTNNSRTNTDNLSQDTAKVASVWVFGNGATSTVTTRAPRSAVYNQPGTYSVTLYAAKGSCIEKVVKVINVEIPSSLVIPNVFTPNGDGVNDIYFLKTANITEISAVIYDRWGHVVYETTTASSNIAWDGKNQAGKDVAEGTYYYIIKTKGKDGKDTDNKGTINLYR